MARMAVRYGSKNRIPDLVGSVYFELAKIGDARYDIPRNSSLSTKKDGPYRILEQISTLPCRLQLRPGMANTYPVIHMEQAKCIIKYDYLY